MIGIQDIKRWAVLAIVVAIAAWFLLAGALQKPVVTAKARDSWTLPQLPRWKLATGTLALVAEASYWERTAKIAQEAPPPAVDERWRLSGVVGVGADRKALVTFADPNRPQQLLKLGEALPGGYRITRIEERSVCVALGKRSYTLALERLEQAQ